MSERMGRYIINLPSKPRIIGAAAVVGSEEGKGPLLSEFDYAYKEDYIGEKNFELGESRLLKDAINRAIVKSGLKNDDMDMVFAGDLLNQCIASTFGLMEFNIPFSGIYGACSTFSLSLALAGIMADSGAVRYAVAASSSHFCSAERQYRFPLEYGGQRAPTAQRTVTGSGAAVISAIGSGPYIDKVMIGRIEDLGIKDINNMGAAMAPAAARTVIDFLRDSNTTPADYDMILTGDLGSVGSELLLELLQTRENTDISQVHKDCGVIIFDAESQQVNAGGSGCACSAAVFCSLIMRLLKENVINKVLLVGTGALMSSTSAQQGRTIPSIAHAVSICN